MRSVKIKVSDKKQLSARLSDTAKHYRRSLKAAQKDLRRRRFGQALRHCQMAISLCPESEACDLRERIIAQRRKSEARRDRLHQRFRDLSAVLIKPFRLLVQKILWIVTSPLLLSRILLRVVPRMTRATKEALGDFFRNYRREILVILLVILAVLTVVVALGYAAWWVFSDESHFVLVGLIACVAYALFRLARGD